jgi:hypothetical protein
MIVVVRRLIVVVAVVLVFGAVSLAAAAGGGGALVARELLLPAGARGASNVLLAVQCPGTGDCVAVGYYSVPGSGKVLVERAMGAVEHAGDWEPATPLSVPSDADSSQPQAAWSLACPAGAGCAGFGWYTRASGEWTPMTVNEARGTWSRGQPLVLLPGTAVGKDGHGTVDAACTTATDCVAALSFWSGGVAQVSVVSETSGKWGPIRTVVLPADADNAEPRFFTSVSCSSAGNCVAVGNYTRRGSGLVPMQVTESGGAWKRAVALVLPQHARGGNVRSVFCPATGDCVAVGFYQDQHANDLGFADSETRGTWQRATTLVAPPGSLPPGNGRTRLPAIVMTPFAVTCASPGNCAAVGGYEDSEIDGQAMVATETNGAWTQARAVTLPGDATRTPHAQVAWFLGVAPTRANTYVAVGGYERTANRGTPMTVSFSSI